MTANKAKHSLKRGGLQNQQEHHTIFTKYEAVHPTTVSENNSSSGMLIILTIYKSQAGKRRARFSLTYFLKTYRISLTSVIP